MTQTTQTNTQAEQENEKSMTDALSSEIVQDDGLTWKQRLFLNAYTGEARGNATRAAELAGYQGDRFTLTPYASKLLQHPTIAACVRERARTAMGEHETLESLAAYIRNPPSNPIERNAWVKAIELMMKYHGVLTDKVEHSGTVEQQVKQIIIHVPVEATKQIKE